MRELSEFRSEFELALVCLLNNWRVWMGNDELRALHIGFDSTNTEIAISLLTDREPYLEEYKIEPFCDPWPTADWRLTCVNKTGRHGFPDAVELLDWMNTRDRALAGLKQAEQRERLHALNFQLKSLFFEVATGAAIKQELRRFRRIAVPFRIRVEWFDEASPPLDHELFGIGAA